MIFLFLLALAIIWFIIYTVYKNFFGKNRILKADYTKKNIMDDKKLDCIKNALHDLEQNKDLEIHTDSDLVAGYICAKLHKLQLERISKKLNKNLGK